MDLSRGEQDGEIGAADAVESAGEERSGVYDCGGSKGDDEDKDLVAEFGREGEEGGCALHWGGRHARDLCSRSRGYV